MKSVLIAALAFGMALCEYALGSKQALWIPASCMTRIRFTKSCRSVSSSLASCDHVEVEYRCLSAKQGEDGKVEVEQ